jgi:TPR repeat protein
VAALKISDYSTAMTMFTPLASLGHSKAQYLLGEMNAYGWGTAKDDAAAIRWFKRASMWSAPGVQPEAPAEFFVGQNYDKGVGVDRDPVEAEKWYRRSAEGGYGLAKERLRSSENPVASDENPSASKQP